MIVSHCVWPVRALPVRSASHHHLVVSRQYLCNARMVVGHSLLLTWLPGTHWVTICVIRRLALTVSDVCPRLVCFLRTSIQRIRSITHYALCKFMTYDIIISQGSVATHLRCSGIVNDCCIANFLEIVSTVKEFWKLVNIWRSFV